MRARGFSSGRLVRAESAEPPPQRFAFSRGGRAGTRASHAPPSSAEDPVRNAHSGSGWLGFTSSAAKTLKFWGEVLQGRIFLLDELGNLLSGEPLGEQKGFRRGGGGCTRHCYIESLYSDI